MTFRSDLLCLCLAILMSACTIGDIKPPTVGTAEDEDSVGFFDLALTRAETRATTTVVSQDEADNFLITIYKGSDVVRETTKLKDVNTRLSAGYGYVVQAENCSETEAETLNDGWGQRRFHGLSEPFAIKAGQTTSVNVACTIANAGFSIIFDDTFTSKFTSYSVTITEGSRHLVFDTTNAAFSSQGGEASNGAVAYFTLGNDGTRTITYTITASGEGVASVNVTREITLSKAVVNRIRLKAAEETGTLTITISYDDSFDQGTTTEIIID